MEMKLEIVGLIAIGKLIRYNRKDLSFYKSNILLYVDLNYTVL